MPQFELDNVGSSEFSGLVRGRTAEEAVRRGANTAEEVAVAPEADVQGWRDVKLDGEASGKVRLHQRMQFRRD